MGKIPQGFIAKGLGAAGKELLVNLGRGGMLSEDYYFTLAAEQIWYEFIERKTADSATPISASLSLDDLIRACRMNGIPCIRRDEDEILVTMPNHSYMFGDYLRQYNCIGVYGGPVDGNLNFQGYMLDETGMMITVRAFVRLLMYFDGIIDSIKGDVAEHIRRVSLDYRMSRIMNASMKPWLEPGLEDIRYMYSCCMEKEKPSLKVYLYGVPRKDMKPSPEDGEIVLKVIFGCEDFLGNLQTYKNMLRVLASGKADYNYYRCWAVPLELWEEEIPDWSVEKLF